MRAYALACYCMLAYAVHMPVRLRAAQGRGMTMVTGPPPLPLPSGQRDSEDLMPRLDRVLRDHPEWSIRYDGHRDVFRAWRKVHGGETREIVRYRLTEVLDELEAR